jgi:hypothetical protein
VAAQQRLDGFYQSSAMFHSFRQVDSQDRDCRPADRRLSNQLGTVPHEMFVPHVLAGIKQRMQLVCGWIVTYNIRPLVRVAIEASQSQIAQVVAPLMFLRPNVIDFMRQDGSRLRELAVFALAIRAIPDLLSPRFGHDL